MSKETFPLYTTNYISGVLSLRKPQKVSLEILANILERIPLSKSSDLSNALNTIHDLYPICTDFERDFISLTFALATGVGKTRLMGAFIAYLYTQKDICNFFVVAPNTTIYEKLKRDLGDSNSPKYVFRGLGCFNAPPHIITDDDYREKTFSLFESNVHIFIYNIDKFNKEGAKMRSPHEKIGDSFYKYLSDLSDLVLIMDESHHYRADRGTKALNDLHPVLGLELTATPLAKVGTKQVPFKNVVFEYPLSKAIEDGYTRTPFAVTRTDIDFFHFGEDQLDRLMLQDGIACHENAKRKLRIYAENHDKHVVKPFMLVVCKDTDHAAQIEQYIRSDQFQGGAYRGLKTITIHSKQKGAESDQNLRLLLEVERPDNPVEIVIHVNMLKEGWDVNNLYTIVPLRTATSKILREQMVGRGLRLPYGERTGDRDVDAVMLTAHDKFQEILEEAQKGDSIFKAGNIIKAEELPQEKTIYPQIVLPGCEEDTIETGYAETGITRSEAASKVFYQAHDFISQKIAEHICNTPDHRVTQEQEEQIANAATERLSQDQDLGATFQDNENPFTAWIRHEVKKIHRETVNRFIPIPQICVTDAGADAYSFSDFDLDLSKFNHTPIKTETLVQNLLDPTDRQRVKGKEIDFEGYLPKKVILAQLREKPEIDYERCSKLLFKLITQTCEHYEKQYSVNGMQNIVMMYKRDIGQRIYDQMMQHFTRDLGLIQEDVMGARTYNLRPSQNHRIQKSLYESFTGNIREILFTGIKRGVFDAAKFDSEPELLFARVLERDEAIKNWLRPAKKEFNITYDHGRQYEPDFVVETEELIYLTEIKREDELEKPDVLAKKERGIQYCQIASRWGAANGYKEWRYLFIPSKQVQENSIFATLVKRFVTA